MPVTKIDETVALILFDQQKLNRYEMGRGLPAELVVPLDDVIARTAELADAFRAKGWPVAHAKVPNAFGHKLMREGKHLGGRIERGFQMTHELPDDFDQIVDELAPHPDDLVVAKPMWDAYIGTTLDYDFRQRGVTQVFLTGLMTHIGVDATARSTWNRGYNLVSVIDAMTDFDRDGHFHTIDKILPRIGERATTAEVLAAIK